MTADEPTETTETTRPVPDDVLTYWRVHAGFTRAALRKEAWVRAPWWKRLLTRVYDLLRHPKCPAPIVWTREDECDLADRRALSTHRFSALPPEDQRLAAAFVCECGEPAAFVAAVDAMLAMKEGGR